ncbi:hypothetical protein BGW41_007289, partial [Actinomortierella wolfii]
ATTSSPLMVATLAEVSSRTAPLRPSSSSSSKALRMVTLFGLSRTWALAVTRSLLVAMSLVTSMVSSVPFSTGTPRTSGPLSLSAAAVPTRSCPMARRRSALSLPRTMKKPSRSAASPLPGTLCSPRTLSFSLMMS